MVFCMYCVKILYVLKKNYLDKTEQLLADVKLIKQYTIYDTPKMKLRIKSQLLSILKQSFSKILLRKGIIANDGDVFGEIDRDSKKIQDSSCQIRKKLCFEN